MKTNFPKSAEISNTELYSEKLINYTCEMGHRVNQEGRRWEHSPKYAAHLAYLIDLELHHADLTEGSAMDGIRLVFEQEPFHHTHDEEGNHIVISQ